MYDRIFDDISAKAIYIYIYDFGQPYTFAGLASEDVEPSTP
jgi:hypothetical protein